MVVSFGTVSEMVRLGLHGKSKQEPKDAAQGNLFLLLLTRDNNVLWASQSQQWPETALLIASLVSPRC